MEAHTKALVDATGAPFVNVLDPAFTYNQPEVAAAREQSWCGTTPLGLIVLRYQECQEVLRDRRFRPEGAGYMRKLGITGGPLYDMWMNAMMSADPRDHARIGVTARPSRTRLAMEGDTVAVRLPGGQAMVTAVGPAVPEEGESPVPTTSPCRFTVTVAAVHGSIPLSSRAFSFLGEHGERNGARVTLRGGGRLPRRIVAGQPVTLTLSSVLPVGNGQLRWAPMGGRPVVSWDFDVELD